MSSSRLLLAAVLAAATVTGRAGTAPAITVATAHSVCVPTASINYDGDPDPADSCVVTAFKAIPHSEPQLFYQQQAFLSPEQAKAKPQPQALLADPLSTDGAGMAVLQEQADERLTVITSMSGQDAYFDPPPHLQATPQGPILLVPASAIVSSAPDLGVEMRRIGGRWITIVDAWSATVAKRLPKDVAQWKGGLMDWPHLRASSALWRAADTDCCPTGGSYTAQLRLDGSRLVLVSLEISKRGLPE